MRDLLSEYMAVKTASKELRNSVLGRHPLQGQSGGSYRKQGEIHGHWCRYGRLQGRFGYVHRGTRNIEVLADGTKRA